MASQNSSTSPTHAVKRKSECSQRTITTVEVTCTWKIEEATLKYKDMGISSCLESKTFSANIHEMEKWKVQCYLAGEEKAGFLAIYVKWLQTSSDLTANIEISVLDAIKGKFAGKKIASHTFSTNEDDWGFEQFLSHKVLFAKNSKYVKENSITLQCKISYEIENPTQYNPCTVKAPRHRSSYFQNWGRFVLRWKTAIQSWQDCFECKSSVCWQV